MHFSAPPALPPLTTKGRSIMKKRLIEYEPSPGSQVCFRRMSACSCSLTLWCGLWLHPSMVGGLAYDVL